MTKYEDALRIANILNYRKINEAFGNSEVNINPEDEETIADRAEEAEKSNKQPPAETPDTSTPDPKDEYYTILNKYFNDGVKKCGWGSKLLNSAGNYAKNIGKSLASSASKTITGLAAIPANAIHSTASALSGKNEAQTLASTLTYADSLKPIKESDVTLSDNEKTYGEKLFNWYGSISAKQRLDAIKGLNSSQLSTLTKYIAANIPNVIITNDVSDALQKLGGSLTDNDKTKTTDNVSKTDQAKTDQAKTDQTKTDQTKTGETQIGRAHV